MGVRVPISPFRDPSRRDRRDRREGRVDRVDMAPGGGITLDVHPPNRSDQNPQEGP